MIYLAGFIIFIAMILGNLNDFAIKRVLKDNGFTVKYFSGLFTNTRNIFKLAKATTDIPKQNRYYRMGFFDITCGLAFLSAAIFMFSSIPSLQEGRCRAFREFKSQEYEVVIVDKYIDKNNHSYPMLIGRNLKDNITVDQNLVHDKSGFFSFVTIGDTLRKQKNEASINIRNHKTDTIYVLDYGCKEKNN